MGLNLTEFSSGKLKISKRGHSQVRRWLYFSALRWIKAEPVKSYEAGLNGIHCVWSVGYLCPALIAHQERRSQFRGASDRRLDQISDATNSTVVVRRYVPGKRFEVPESDLSQTNVSDTAKPNIARADERSFCFVDAPVK